MNKAQNWVVFYGNNAYREEDNTRVYNRSLKDLLNSFLIFTGFSEHFSQNSFYS